MNTFEEEEEDDDEDDDDNEGLGGGRLMMIGLVDGGTPRQTLRIVEWGESASE
jgi:hypothetical protein